MGFSLLSGVEIIYFFTLRAFCMVYKDEEVLLEIDRKKRRKPLEEFNLGLELNFNHKKKPNFKEKNKKSKLMIFDGTPRPIPQFIQNSRRFPVSSTTLL